MTNLSLSKSLYTKEAQPIEIEYTSVLEQSGASFIKSGYRYRVGELPTGYGWVFHLSVVATEVSILFYRIIPFLLNERLCFEIPQNKEIVKSILTGSLGYDQVGKILSIYPSPSIDPETILVQLLKHTEGLRGPAVPTGVRVGEVIYTQLEPYNIVSAIDNEGNVKRCAISESGEAIPAEIEIPFSLPKSLFWPFRSVPRPGRSKNTSVLEGKVKLLTALKRDARGDVWYGIYKKGLFRFQPCVVKQGRKNACWDDLNRDIRQRLLWQKKVHSDLISHVPLPAILDYFEVDEDAYLVMEYIKGSSFNEVVASITNKILPWRVLSHEKKLAVIGIVRQLIFILSKCHENGYVHRDVTPPNFILHKNKKMFLIDLELAYFIKEGIPSPPYGLGTLGFMSPEQEKSEIPDVREDVYGFCASLVLVLTNFSPLKFQGNTTEETAERLNMFIDDPELSELIARGLSNDPLMRPNLECLNRRFEQITQEKPNSSTHSTSSVGFGSPSKRMIEQTIVGALKGLTIDPTLNLDGLWASGKLSNETYLDTPQNEYGIYPGLEIGVSGVMFAISQAKIMGYSNDGALSMYQNSWAYLKETYLNKKGSLPPTYFSGMIGIAQGIAAGVLAELIEDNSETRSYINGCFELPPAGKSIAFGLSGYGMGLLHCQAFLPEDFFTTNLNLVTNYFVKNRDNDGLWSEAINGKKVHSKSLINGVTGIAWFLLHAYQKTGNQELKKAVIIPLQWLLKNLYQVKTPKYKREDVQRKDTILEEGPAGIYWLLLKAYEVLKENVYSDALENGLNPIPPFIVSNNLTQNGGLSFLGEMYMEAYRILGKETYRERAEWLVHTILTVKSKSAGGGIYWQLDESKFTTADLLTGSSGLIHFLLKFLHNDEIGFWLTN